MKEEMIFGIEIGKCKVMWNLNVKDDEIVCS
jgi:hypothetical protein